MNLIKKRIDAYIMSLIEKDNLTVEEYLILLNEYERRKAESEVDSNDTILRIFKALN